MINLALVGSVASNTLLTNLSSKLVERMLYKPNNIQKEKKQWLYNAKLECFSLLSMEILSCNEDNICSKKECIEKHLSKIILLIEDRKLIQTLENYLFILNEYDNAKEIINLQSLNKELIHTLSRNITSN